MRWTASNARSKPAFWIEAGATCDPRSAWLKYINHCLQALPECSSGLAQTCGNCHQRFEKWKENLCRHDARLPFEIRGRQDGDKPARGPDRLARSPGPVSAFPEKA